MIDLNKPVENPEFKKALASHYQKQSQESAATLFTELMKAVFLIGVITDHPITNETGPQMFFKQDEKIGVFEVRDVNDAKLLALFSDHQELASFSTQANATWVMPTAQAFDFALHYSYAGVVVNPSSPNTLRLDSKFIESLKVKG